MILFLLISAYFLGSIPFGLVLTKLMGLGDIRLIGSGNIGATNVWRTGNKSVAALTLFLDAGKGALIMVVLKYLGAEETIVALAGLAAVIGHIFPIWLRFKGGKGVATTLAVFFILHYPMGIVCCLCWIIIFTVYRVSSLAAIATMAIAPLCALFMPGVDSHVFGITFLLSVLVLSRHKENMQRLIRGKELDFKKKNSS